MNNDSLALELLKQVKADSRKWFIAFMVMMIMFFASNILWLYAWTLPTSDSTTTEEAYDIDASDNGNAIYNDSGEVTIDGKN